MPCSICGKPAADFYKPFCCKRCADVDLGRWFNGTYALESDESVLDEEMEVDKFVDKYGDESVESEENE